MHLKFSREPQAAAPSAVLSVALHALLIALAVVRPLATTVLDSGSFTPLQYFPPPNPVRSAPMPEQLRYVEMPADPVGAGFQFNPYSASRAGRRDAPRTDAVPTSAVSASVATDDSLSLVGAAREDSAFTEIEVDVPATRMPNSAAPAYPAQLLKDGVEGMAIVRYVVDTSGRADTTTLTIVMATHREFAEAVRRALPGMRFSTARLGELQVRQLVEQPFTFQIQRP